MRKRNLLILAMLFCMASISHAQLLNVGMPALKGLPVVKSNMGKSHVKRASTGEVKEIPYMATFATEEMFNEFTVINANNDQKSSGVACTWYYNPDLQTARYSYSGENQADDWLISPAIHLEAGVEYKFTINCKNFKSQYYGDYEEKFEVKLGQGVTVEAMTQQVMNTKTVRGGVFADFTAKGIYVSETGDYNLGVHCVSDAYRGELDVKSLKLEMIPQGGAPAAVTSFTVVPNAIGDPAATISFNAPTKAYDGGTLTGTMSIRLSRNGAELKLWEDVSPGETLTYTDADNIPNGDNTYQVLPFNSVGQGVMSEKTAYVGVDVPLAVTGITFSEPNATTLKMSWDAVGTVGENGHTVNPELVGYAVFSTLQDGSQLVVDEQLGFIVNKTSLSFPNNNDEGTQKRRYWIVVPVNLAGTGAYTMAAHYTGKPHDLPFEEHVTATGFTYSTWLYDVSSPKYVILDLSEESSDGDNLALKFYNTSSDSQWGKLCAGKIALAGAENPKMEFDVKNVEGTNNVRVNIITPDGESTAMAAFAPTGSYETESVDLSQFANERYVMFEVFTDFTAEGTVYFDNFRIRDVKSHDLAIEMDAPKTARVGICDTDVRLMVKNEGENDASDFSLKLYADDKLIGEEHVTTAVQAKNQSEYSFAIPFACVKKTGMVGLRAEVDYAADQNEANNAVEGIVSVVESDLPKPENLVAQETTDGLNLAWDEPVIVTKSVVEDFEDQSVFPEFGFGALRNQYGAFGSWTVYDGDNMTNYGFNSYSFPGNGNVSAWQVFRPESISATFLDEWNNYVPYSGDQYLVAWCPNDGSQADNWLISPLVSDEAQTITFQYAVLADQYGAETFDVMASSTTKDISSFDKVSSFAATNIYWNEGSVELPAGTRYFALRHTSEDIFGLMIDDIEYIAGGNKVLGYNIYVDGILVGAVSPTEVSYALAALSEEPHTIGVTAVYEDNMESSPAYVKLNEPTGVMDEGMKDEGRWMKDEGVYDLQGRCIGHLAPRIPELRSPTRSLSSLPTPRIQKGIYITNGKKYVRK